MRVGYAGSRAVALGLALVLSPFSAAAAEEMERVFVRGPKPYHDLEAAVVSLGGVVTQRFENVDLIAAEVPKDRLTDLMVLTGGQASRQGMVNIPRDFDAAQMRLPGVQPVAVEAEAVQSLEGEELRQALAVLPQDYNFNNALIGASVLHAGGNTGQGIIVAVIDSGTANSPNVPSLFLGTPSVLGGETFLPGDSVASPTSRLNGPHGTWVGGVIASHVAFGFSNASRLIQSMKLHAPSSILGPCPNPSPPAPAVACFVPLVGVAPAARIYAMKVFPASGGGTPEEVIIAAIDRAITLRRNFNNGVPSVPVAGDGSENNPFRFDSLKIDVVNMSLGGGTLNVGRSAGDEITTRLLEVGITPVVSAGNDGFAAMTVGSPGTAFGALTLGAASTPPHERILRDNQFGIGFGAAFRPAPHVQTAWFSSRGPNADGRFDPEITANGFATLTQGTCQTSAACIAGTGGAPISFVSGTSFSAPTAAGAAALLRKADPGATAAQIRNALVKGANPFLLGDLSKRIDQGRGFLDVVKSQDLLLSDRVGSHIPESHPSSSVKENIEDLGFEPVRFRDGVFNTRIRRLRPGQVAQFFLESTDATDAFKVSFSNVTPELPPALQNQFFGDDLFVQAVDAPTSFAESKIFDFVNGDASYDIVNPQTGLLRVAVQGDWTNAGRISADLSVERIRNPQGPATERGRVGQGEFVPFVFEVPASTTELVVELAWRENWGHYPTDDVDLLLIDLATLTLNFDGATFRSPERAVIQNPPGGIWIALVNGFTVHGSEARFRMRATADGVRLP